MFDYLRHVAWASALIIVVEGQVQSQELPPFQGDIPVAVRERLQKVSHVYKGFPAFEQIGDVIVEITAKGKETKTIVGTTFIAIVRPVDFLVEFGNSAMSGSSHELSFYDFSRRRIYVYPAPKPGTALSTLDIANPGPDSASRALAALVDKSFRREGNSQTAASAIGFSASSVILSFLFEETPQHGLLQQVASAELREHGPADYAIILKYKTGGIEELKLVNDTFKSIRLTFGKEELGELSIPDMPLENLVVYWQAKNMTIDAQKVAGNVAERRAALKARTSDYEQRLAAALPADRIPVPTPPRGKGLISYMRDWLRSLL